MTIVNWRTIKLKNRRVSLGIDADQFKDRYWVRFKTLEKSAPKRSQVVVTRLLLTKEGMDAFISLFVDAQVEINKQATWSCSQEESED